MPDGQGSRNSVRHAVCSGAWLQLHLPIITGPVAAGPAPHSCRSPPPLGLLESGWVTSLLIILQQFHCVPESPVQLPDLVGS